MSHDARREDYMLVDMDGYICLFTNLRLDRNTIPDGLYCYDVRDADCDGSFAEIQPFVLVNHWGTIISKEPIPLNEYHCYWPEGEEVYLPPSLSLETYQSSSIAKLVRPYLSDDEKSILGDAIHTIPDNVFRLRHKPFLHRSGEEQEQLLDFYLTHKTELSVSVSMFLGISESAYQAWRSGALALGDGTRHVPRDMASAFFFRTPEFGFIPCREPHTPVFCSRSSKA